MSEFDEMIKQANLAHIELIKNIEQQKEEAICYAKKCIYVYNNLVFDDLNILKSFIDYDNIDLEFKKNLFYYKCCLNENFSVKKNFIN